jgi:uncharacterized membrane protein YoaK (UPF0700 family)
MAASLFSSISIAAIFCSYLVPRVLSLVWFPCGQTYTVMADIDLPKEHVDSEDVGLALLGFAAGSMDALAFFNLGEVFPSAMTGNTALLGLALGQGHVIAASRPFIAFAGFLAGAAAAAASVDLWLHKLPTPRAVYWLFALEACLLAAFALAWQFIGWPIAGVGLYGLIVLASSGMGIQSVAARLVARSGIATVVFTSTLTSIVTSAIEAMLRPPHRLPFAAKRQIGIFLIYGLGAAICGLLASHGTLIAFLPFVAVVGAASFQRRAGRQDKRG